MFQESINDVSSVLRFFQLSFKGVSSRFSEDFEEISKVFYGNYKGVSKEYQKYFKEVSRWFCF